MENSIRVIPIECKFGPTSAYAYYIDAPEPALIDTGIHSSAAQEIEPVLAEHGVRIEDIRWILLTHGHVDHLGGARAVWEKTGRQAEVVIPKKEAYLLRNRKAHITDYENLQGKYLNEETRTKHIAILINDIGEEIKPTVEVTDGDHLSLGGDVSIRVIATPGHSLGSVTFMIEGFEWAFAADAIQMHGGEKSGIPTIEDPVQYRESVKRLQKLQPKRLYLGHHFRGGSGKLYSSQIDGEEVSAVLEDSLKMDAKLAEIVRRHLDGNNQNRENDEIYGPFKSIAEELNYTGDPRHLPCAFFVTINGYQEELIGVHNN